MFTVLFIKTDNALGGVPSEAQRARTAEKYYVAKQFDKAAPLFAQLVSSNPKSYKYNYYYGICLLITGKDKNLAIPYMEAAMQNPKTPEDIFYYYGRACHLTYRFNESLASFVEYNNIIGAKNSPKWSIPQMLEMVNNAKKILDSSKLNSITEKTECLASDFYSKYVFQQPNGKLLSMPDEIIAKSKSSNEERPMIFLSSNGRVMYYSAKSDASNSRDIFRMEKDIDGNWGTADRIQTMINTTQDELFPTCNSDGRILYFSSRGHASSGGFDIFKAYYNVTSKTWSKPENMGSPYNSPDDDLCFVASTHEQTAYFTSQRETGPGSFTVYKVPYLNTEELPIAINGRFNCIGNPDLKKINLTVSRDGDSNIVASLITDAINGTYILELPGPGKYKFSIEAEGFQPHNEDVRFGEFSDRIYIQDIFLSRAINGIEDIAISNRRLTESGLVDDASLTATNDEMSNLTLGTSEADKAAMKLSGIDPEIAAAEAAAAMASKTETDLSIPNDGKKIPLSIEGLVFKVQIGAFTKSQREIVQKRLEKKADKSLMTSYDDLTWLRFFMGGEVNYKSAENLKATLIQAGFTDSFIVAFNNGKPINLYSALQKLKLR
jgi:hypothetical protein